ncbi:hypothetical protein EM308_01510 [Flavobacterium gilvum]|uniref:Uncharacterized protein n=1 Tax=Flavobacterium gilvum TaxID=1492737 RepID=A0AAC9N377_9FLAO|nr:hypothetical protein EM308_01510 [Flavobacterium gilvum]
MFLTTTSIIKPENHPIKFRKKCEKNNQEKPLITILTIKPYTKKTSGSFLFEYPFSNKKLPEAIPLIHYFGIFTLFHFINRDYKKLRHFYTESYLVLELAIVKYNPLAFYNLLIYVID